MNNTTIVGQALVNNFRDTLIKLDLDDYTNDDRIRMLAKAFSASCYVGAHTGNVIDLEPGATLDTLLKSVTFP